MQRAGRRLPIDIDIIAADDRAQLVQVEMSVARLQRLKGPGNQGLAAAQRGPVLGPFELLPRSLTTMDLSNCQHVGMLNNPLAQQGRKTEDESNQGCAFVKGAQQDTTTPPTALEHGSGNHILSRKAPHLNLQVDTSPQVFLIIDLTDGNGQSRFPPGHPIGTDLAG